MLEHSDKNVISLEMLYIPFKTAVVLLNGLAVASSFNRTTAL